MKRRLWVYVLFFFGLGLIFFAIVSWLGNESTLRQVVQSAAGGFVYLLVFTLIELISKGHRAKAYFLSMFWYRRTRIRMSMSYLIRVRMDDRYVLVYCDTFKMFQPIGGVYKRMSGGQQRLDDMGVTDDEKMPVDDENRGDLRLHVEGRRLMDFLEWFDSKRNREYGAWREFYQEMIESNLLPEADFRFVLFRWVRRHETGIQHSPYLDCMEYKIADIVEAELDDKQKVELRNSIAKHPRQLRAATAAEIRQFGSTSESPGASIAETATWLLES